MLQQTVPAIWTAMYAELHLVQALITLAGQGWSVFELSTEHFCELETAADRDARVARVRDVCHEYSLHMPQGHALLQANVAHPDAAQRSSDMARLREHIRLARELGVQTVVVHPGRGKSMTTRDQRQQTHKLNVQAFRELGDLAGELGCRLAIENMSRRGFCSPAELLDLLDAVGSDAVGITFDSSHAHMTPLIDIPAAIQDFGGRLWATHLSDNDGSGDQHRTPGNGTIDWPALMQALNAIDYPGILNLEIPGERHPDPGLRTLKSKHARAVADWLMTVVA